MEIFWGFAMASWLLAFLLLALGGMSKLWSAISAATIGGLVGTLGYFDLPVLAYGWESLGWYLAIVSAVCCAILMYADGKVRWSAGGIALAAVYVIVLPLITSAEWFHVEKYRNLLGSVDESKLDTSIPAIDVAQVRTVDEDVAMMLMKRQLGQDPGLGSRAEIGDAHIQILTGTFTVTDPRGTTTVLRFREKGELFWVAPIVHQTILRQWAEGTTPGFALASATDQTKVYIVEKVNGKPVTLEYFAEGGYWARDVRRHLWRNGYMRTGLTNFSFELNNEGHPYWVVTKYVNRIGFGGEDAVGVVTVDAQTGAIADYSINTIPSWVNLVQPKDFVESQYNRWGRWVHGWWNGLFVKKDVLKLTPGMEYIFGEDGGGKWYSGLVTTGNDKSTAGMVFIDGITKQVTVRKFAGVSEGGAQRAIENHPSVKAQGYSASFPVVYTVAKVPSYFFILKGSDKTPQSYGWMKVDDFNVAATGRTPDEALHAYQLELRKMRTVTPDATAVAKSAEGKVVAVRSLVENGNTVIYLRLDSVPGKEFFAPSTHGMMLKWVAAGDVVEIAYDEGESTDSIPIAKFTHKGYTAR